MLHRFLPLAALILYVSVSLPAHAQAQQGAAGAVRGRIVDSVTGRAVPTATVHLMRNQRVHGTVEADTAGEFSFDHVPEGVYSVEVEEQGYVKAVQADVRVVLRRVAAVEFALVRGSDTAGAGNPTSSLLRALFTRPLHVLHAAFTLIGPEFKRGEPSWASRPAQ